MICTKMFSTLTSKSLKTYSYYDFQIISMGNGQSTTTLAALHHDISIRKRSISASPRKSSNRLEPYYPIETIDDQLRCPRSASPLGTRKSLDSPKQVNLCFSTFQICSFQNFCLNSVATPISVFWNYDMWNTFYFWRRFKLDYKSLRWLESWISYAENCEIQVLKLDLE